MISGEHMLWNAHMVRGAALDRVSSLAVAVVQVGEALGAAMTQIAQGAVRVGAVLNKLAIRLAEGE